MAPQAYIEILNGTTGARKAIFTGTGTNGFLYLAWEKIVNGIHFAEFALNGEHPDLSLIADKDILVIYRLDPAINLTTYITFDGLIRDDYRETDKDNTTIARFQAYGHNERLQRRIIAYPANKANYTTFGSVKGETLLKLLVRDNADPAFATTGNGRDRTPSTLNLTIAADTLAGNTINGWSCGNRPNLLTELQKVVLVSGGDFDVVRTSATTYEFRFYLGQLGTDRTTGANAIIFSTDRGNMGAPRLERVRSNEKTAAIVGGSGQEAARVIRTRTGSTFSAANDIEMFVEGRNSDSTAALDLLGDSALKNAIFRNAFDYDVLQTALYSVEKDYFLGDKVKARAFGLEVTQQVYKIAFAYRSGTEESKVTMRDVT